jgi:uncharacterized damage-inducible protein DinB
MVIYAASAEVTFRPASNSLHMKNNLHDWFQWNNAANESFINAFKNSTITPEKCIEIFSRIISEHERWLNRICMVNLGPDDKAPKVAEHLAQKNALMHEITTKFLSSESYGNNLDWSFSYESQGAVTQQTLSEVYFHILTFSEYHRGQAAEMLKENGIEPPSTDYISLKGQLN